MINVPLPRLPSSRGARNRSLRRQLEIVRDVLCVTGEDPANRLDIDCAQVTRCSCNSDNGLWAFHLKDGKKLYLQTSGILMSADRSGGWAAATESIAELLAKHGVSGFSI